jgi:transposase InsO family protein
MHHSDSGSQHVSILYTVRIAEAGIEPQFGGIGYGFAEPINCLYKAKVIHRRDPLLSFMTVEHAMLEWVDCFNHFQLLEPITRRRSKGTLLCLN